MHKKSLHYKSPIDWFMGDQRWHNFPENSLVFLKLVLFAWWWVIHPCLLAHRFQISLVFPPDLIWQTPSAIKNLGRRGKRKKVFKKFLHKSNQYNISDFLHWTVLRMFRGSYRFFFSFMCYHYECFIGGTALS